MTEKRWLYKPLPQSPDELACVDSLCRSLNIEASLATMLWQRGVTCFDEAHSFFRPSLDSLHDPFLMRDMDRAVARLEEAFGNGERILVYGDYDVDGTTSVALFYGFLKTFYDEVEFYIPDRYKEGYGVQPAGIEYARVNRFSLIITLDCGIKSVELIALAQNYGIDFIICDHHRPGAGLPPAVAVLDPKRADCDYPYKELTGCGVGFKLLQAFCQNNNIPATRAYEYLDLVAVSIAADIVPITGENRILAFYGLKRLNESPRAGLKALIQVAGFQKTLDITNVVFGLGPRINAAGRVKHANDSVDLLLCEDETRALDFAQKINVHNNDRRDFDVRITQEALTMIESDDWYKTSKSTVLYKNDWHKGVIGIVASRCIEKYYRPTIILTASQDKVAGSARSVAGFDVYEAIEDCADLLEQFGGHMYAAGLTLKVENVPAFRQRFEEAVIRRIKPDQLSPLIDIDFRLSLEQISAKFYRIMNQMEPFGPQNMSPVFVSERVRLRGLPRIMKEKHLRLDVFREGSPVFAAIGFGMAHFYESILTHPTFDICYQVDINEYKGQRTLQLRLRDIKF